jgi:hypothetical protein
MEFVQRVGSKKDEKEKIEVHLVRGKSDSGSPIYAYLAVYASQVRDLNLSLITRTTDLEKYGVILASGEGEPSNEVQQYIKEAFLANGS